MVLQPGGLLLTRWGTSWRFCRWSVSLHHWSRLLELQNEEIWFPRTFSWSSLNRPQHKKVLRPIWTRSPLPNRVVTREVRYIHKLSLTLEHSMPISSPAAPSLTQTPGNSAVIEPRYWPIGSRCWADLHHPEVSEGHPLWISWRSTTSYCLHWEPPDLNPQSPKASLWSASPRANDQTERWPEESCGNN